MLSVMSLPGTEALCASLTISGRIFFRRFARTLAKTLETTLHKLMGRYSVIFLGFFGFWDEADMDIVEFRGHHTSIQDI